MITKPEQTNHRRNPITGEPIVDLPWPFSGERPYNLILDGGKAKAGAPAPTVPNLYADEAPQEQSGPLSHRKYFPEAPGPGPYRRPESRPSSGGGGGSSIAESETTGASLPIFSETEEDTPKEELNWKPLLQLVDSYTGSRFANGYEDPNIRNQRIALAKEKITADRQNKLAELAEKLESRKSREGLDRLRLAIDRDYKRGMVSAAHKNAENRSKGKGISEREYLAANQKLLEGNIAELEELYKANEGEFSSPAHVHRELMAAARENAEAEGIPVSAAYTDLLQENLAAIKVN